MTGPTDKELWDAGCLTRFQLEHWTDGDLAAHPEGIRNTVRHLLCLLGDPCYVCGADCAGAAVPVNNCPRAKHG